MRYVIQNIEAKYWSNTFGWSEEHNAEIYHASDRDTVALPMGGRWVEITYRQAYLLECRQAIANVVGRFGLDDVRESLVNVAKDWNR